MTLQLTISDQSLDGRTSDEVVVEFLTDRVTVRELIRSRVYQEVQDYHLHGADKFRGLVQPGPEERALNPSRGEGRRRMIDWKAQFEAAIAAFEQRQVLILVDNRQVSSLEEVLVLHPRTAEHPGTIVSFLKLTPLVGG